MLAASYPPSVVGSINMIILIFLATLALANASFFDDLNVTVVVVEYQPLMDSLSSTELVNENTDRFVMMMDGFNEPIDLIVFPEGSLKTDHTMAQEIEIDDNPCDNPQNLPFMVLLSCKARELKTYLVINVVEKAPCDNSSTTSQNCQQTGFYFYNTDVIFDRDGKIIKKYRKFNLFGELTIDRPPKPEVVFVETDFGVKLGIFTCFDILFKNPARDLLKAGVDGVIYPTNWHSELPFLTALQTQQMWAYTHNITLIAAGGHNPHDVRGGSGGSGIHRGAEDTITSVIDAKNISTILIYQHVVFNKRFLEDDVDDLAKNMDNFNIITDNSLTNYTSVPLDTSLTKIDNLQVCSEKQQETQLCCNFTLKLSTSDTVSDTFYTYLLVAYAGIRSFPGIGAGGLEVCGIIACLNSAISSCGRRFPNYEEIEWPVTFEEITITGNFEDNENKMQFPNSLLSSIRPIDASQTDWSSRLVEENVVERTFSVKNPQNRLLTFAIYGRNFTNDSLDGDDASGSASSIAIAWGLLSSLFLWLVLAK